ncbi:glycolate oxidase subunit GlcE [Rhodoferax koreense]|uniref:Glycolate oxidase subunit GlcE n=1 Tax=Rhodoferax koreensis TaxID=1842727 RepID=A0A1P8JQD4_9BURK|nr:glycolate oxidase subunit GlcE [Rhodoferax koreense]APW35951.1 glycolate oxidase subunit GlcE [Rhodoferax koreense]
MTGMDAALQSLITRIADAAATATPLRFRGGGSKDFYGQALRGEIVDTTVFSGITSYEPSELVVSARAGTPLSELEAVLAAKGQCLPFEPPHFAEGATVGGMVAAGLSGPARASVGAVRDYMLGVTLINGRAELLSFGGTVMKNVAGYDVSRLMAGSLGTLGLITEVHLKVLPVPPAEATLRFACGQAEALRLLHAWGGQPLPLNASCWMEAPAGEGVLFLRLRGAVAAVEAACTRLGGELLAPAALAGEDGFAWQALRNHRLPWFRSTTPAESQLWRLSVPQTAPVLDLPGPTLVEWHGGQRWLKAAPGDEARIRATARQVGGSATLFRADATEAVADEARFDALLSPLDGIHLRLKQQFDPAGIFNPGRLYPQF